MNRPAWSCVSPSVRAWQLGLVIAVTTGAASAAPPSPPLAQRETARGGAAVRAVKVAPVLARALPKKKAPPLFFHYGEHINWSVQLRGVEGGLARLAVGSPGRVGDRVLVVVRAQAETTGVIDSIRHVVEEAQSYLDVGSGLPVISESRGETGKKHTHATVERKPDGSAEIVLEKDGSASKFTRTLAPDVQDGLSMLSVLRALPDAGVGSARKIIVYSGAKRWSVSATYKGREVRDTALGEIEVYRLEGSATRVGDDDQPIKAAKAFTGWFSADQRRVPVLLEADTEYGAATLVLTAYSDK